MKLAYTLDGEPGELLLTSSTVDMCTAEDLAEVVAVTHWCQRPLEVPPESMLIHLENVDGHSLGTFEITRALRPVFKATRLGTA